MGWSLNDQDNEENEADVDAAMNYADFDAARSERCGILPPRHQQQCRSAQILQLTPYEVQL